MWPHLISVAMGDTLVVVGTDDHELAAVLEPMRVPSPELPTADFGVELHAPRADRRSAPRRLPTFQHGSRIIGRAADVDALREGVLRTLAALAAPTPVGHLWLSGLPLLRDGGLELAAPDAATSVAHRRLAARGHRPVYVPGVCIDPATLLATIHAPIGSPSAPLVVPLRRWWLDVADAERTGTASLGRLVARAAYRAIDPMRGAEHGPTSLPGLVRLIERLPPSDGRFDG